MTAQLSADRRTAGWSPELRIGIALSALGFVLAGLGACIAVLSRDLNEPTDRLALLSSAFGVGLLVVAVVGPRLLRAWSMTTVLMIGSLVSALGTVLLALAPVYGVAVAGSLCIGLGGALLVLVAPLMLDGPTAAARLSRVNAVASATGILAPVTIGGLDALGPTGRLVLLAAVPPLLLLAFRSRPSAPVGQSDAVESVSVAGEPVLIIQLEPTVETPPPAAGRRRGVAVVLGWLRVVLAVGVEFCFVVWAVARLVDAGLPMATAALLGSAFPIGMAIGRAIGPVHYRGWSPIALGGLLAIVGTLFVSLFDAPALVAVGLAIAGVGVAPLYPVTVAALVATPGLSPDKLSAVGALASGTAILVTPAVLAALARVIELRTAYLITLPLLLTLFVISRPLLTSRTRHQGPDLS